MKPVIRWQIYEWVTTIGLCKDSRRINDSEIQELTFTRKAEEGKTLWQRIEEWEDPETWREKTDTVLWGG